ncbi:MAG: hypothetical protein ACTSYC_08445 [Promethearchaeota archaeon]
MNSDDPNYLRSNFSFICLNRYFSLILGPRQDEEEEKNDSIS